MPAIPSEGLSRQVAPSRADRGRASRSTGAGGIHQSAQRAAAGQVGCDRAPKQVAPWSRATRGRASPPTFPSRKPQAPDAERTAAVRSAQSGMASYYGNGIRVADRFRRPLRRQRHDGRPSHAPVRHQGSGDEQGERSLRRGDHQRSRPVRARPHHRSVDRRRRRHRHDGCGRGTCEPSRSWPERLTRQPDRLTPKGGGGSGFRRPFL